MICATIDWKPLEGNLVRGNPPSTFFFDCEETFLAWVEVAYKEAEVITYYNLEAV